MRDGRPDGRNEVASIPRISFVIHKECLINPYYLFTVGRDSSVGIANTPWAGGSGDLIPLWARFSASVQTGLGAHPASYKMGTGPLSRG